GSSDAPSSVGEPVLEHLADILVGGELVGVDDDVVGQRDAGAVGHLLDDLRAADKPWYDDALAAQSVRGLDRPKILAIGKGDDALGSPQRVMPLLDRGIGYSRFHGHLIRAGL